MSTTTTTTTTTNVENMVAEVMVMGLGNPPPNVDTQTPLPRANDGEMYHDDDVNPYNQIPFSPQKDEGTYVGQLNQDGKKHTVCGMYLFEVDKSFMLYIGGFQDGNPHGKGTLYKHLAPAHVHTLRDMNGIDKVLVFQNEISVYKDYACHYEGIWSAEQSFFLKGKGEYRDKNQRIVGKFVTEVVENVQNKFKFSGKVTLFYANGDEFQGFLYPYDVFYPQRGFYKYKVGHTFRGTFPNRVTNRLDHFGTYVDVDGHTYTGSFREDKKHGENATLLFENGDRFIGKFENDKPVYGNFEQTKSENRLVVYNGSVKETFDPHGRGCKQTYVNEIRVSKYEGYFVNGIKHGEGCEHIWNSQYESDDTLQGYYTIKGLFKNGVLEKGEVRFAGKKRKYNYVKKGIFVNGKLRKGSYFHSNGDEYRGGFDSNGQASGKGTLFREHSIYEGTWKNNQRHGTFNAIRRSNCVDNPGQEPKQFTYIQSENALYENNTIVRSSPTMQVSRKRKAQFDEFKRQCRQRIDDSMNIA